MDFGILEFLGVSFFYIPNLSVFIFGFCSFLNFFHFCISLFASANLGFGSVFNRNFGPRVFETIAAFYQRTLLLAKFEPLSVSSPKIKVEGEFFLILFVFCFYTFTSYVYTHAHIQG